jgi:transposase-like protein
MTDDVPDRLSGTVEVDETYIAGMWYNKPWSIRKRGTKRGRGTSKQPVFGILERNRGIVRAFLVPDVKKKTILPIILATVAVGSTIYSDAYQLYQETPEHGYRHAFVDHHQHEYGRGDVHSNGMEGFWGFLKRRLKTTGGIRRSRLHLFVAEEVWRYNFRKLTEEKKIERLLARLQVKFGG